MMQTCLGVCDHDLLDVRPITAATDAALPVASTTTTSSLLSFSAKASRMAAHVDAPQPFCPPTGAPAPTFHAPQGAHAVFHWRWPEIAYARIRYLSLAAVTEARIRSCSGLQLNEGRIVLNHSAP